MSPTHVDPISVVTVSPVFLPGIPATLEKPESSESSFSDAYNDDVEVTNVKNEETIQADDDDYAMTFGSDGEEHTDRQDIQEIHKIQEISGANDDSGSKSLTYSVPAANPSPAVASQESSAPELPCIGAATHPSHLNRTTVKQAIDSPAANSDVPSVAQITSEPSASKPHTYDEFSAGGIDIQQLLDNITANAEKPESPFLKNHSLPIHASLPPRPNVPQNRIFPDDGPKYFAGTPGLPPASKSYRPPGGVSSIVAAGAPGTSTDPRGGLPPPPTASFHGKPPLTNSNSLASYTAVNRLSPRDMANLANQEEPADDVETKWAPEVQKMYDEFLEDERRYVTEGLWDRFPMGSRLFIGNLPSEKVTKRDLFHIFRHYGKIAQISIKQAYGFVQFLNNDHCYRALDCEQGAEVRGRKMHLEISKPQKNTRNAQPNSSSGQRAKSPDRPVGGRNNRNNDRYDRSTPSTRADDYGRPLRVRDDYRPVRSVSPPRCGFRGRDVYVPPSRDPYDTRDRRRSRSPYSLRDVARYRPRSPSPRARGNEDFDLQIPFRDPRDIPDVQIILMEQLDRQFVSWVENEIRSRGIKVEVMFLSPRVPIEAVIKRQILEGVHAVSRLDVISQNSSKIPLQVFDRSGGANNVRFDEYQNLEPKIAAEVVLRSKQRHAPLQAQPPTYSQSQYFNQPYQSPTVPAGTNLASLVGTLDNATLQKILGTLAAPQQLQNLSAVTSQAIDLAGLLGGFKQQPASQVYVPPTPPIDHYFNGGHSIQSPYIASNAPNQLNQQQPSQPAQQVQNIMAQLARFRK